MAIKIDKKIVSYSVQDKEQAAIELFLKLAHGGFAQPRPRAMVYVAQGVARSVRAIAQVLGRLSDMGGQRDAARLIARAYRERDLGQWRVRG